MPPLPTLSDAKARLGLTTTGDDTLVTGLLADAIAQASHDTGRTFSAASNVTTRYSTDGQASLVIHDRPYTDASRVVTLGGSTQTEGNGVWFLPDRRDQNITTTIQLRYYDTALPDWYKADPAWFDRNLDRRNYTNGSPNDLVITGIIGMPFPDQDVTNGILTLLSFLYWKQKSGGSGIVNGPTGELVELADLDAQYARFVERWRIRTAVSSVG
jgi:hypothetical protein